MKVTKHFNIKEFTVSEQYPHLAQDIILTESDLYKLFIACHFVLEPVREEFGKVFVTSGKRSKMLNKLTNGASKSQHLYLGHDAAVDFYLEANDNLKTAFNFIIHFAPKSFCALILYYHNNLAPNFIHFGLATPDRKNGKIFYHYNGKLMNQDPQRIIVD